MSYDDNPFEDGPATKNPFDDDGSPPSFTSSSSSRASTLRTSPPPAPRETHSPTIRKVVAPSDTSDEGVWRKKEELREKEIELNRREKALDIEEKVVDNGGRQIKNWPVCRPILYQNINQEIPVEQQFLVRAAYYIWIGTVVMLLYNFVVVLGSLIAGFSSQIASMLLSIVYFFFLSTTSFMGFRMLYNGSRKSKSSIYLAYLSFKWFEFISYAWLIVGLPGWGGGGFIVMIDLFDKYSKTMAIIALVFTAYALLIELSHIYLFFHARRFYSRAGGLKAARAQGAAYAVDQAAQNPDLVIKAGKTAYNV